MRIYQEGRDYTEWVEDLEYYIMGLGLSEEANSSRCLGLFITNGGSKVKEVYNMNKGTVKAQYEDNNAQWLMYQNIGTPATLLTIE